MNEIKFSEYQRLRPFAEKILYLVSYQKLSFSDELNKIGDIIFFLHESQTEK